MRILSRIAFVVLLTTQIFGQQSDIRSWQGIGLDYRVVKNLTAHLNLENRLENGLAVHDLFFTETGIAYTINNYFESSAYYRLSQVRQPDNHNYYKENRYYFDLKGSYSRTNYFFQNRLRYENTNSEKGNELFFSEDQTCIRNQLQLGYSISKNGFKPYIGYEFFYRLSDDIHNLYKNHYIFGFKFKMQQNISGKLFYILSQLDNSASESLVHITGIRMNYRIN